VGVFGWLQKSLGRTMGNTLSVVVYNTDLFDEATITRMLDFKTLLRGLLNKLELQTCHS